jgi:hypothetical protein
MMTDANRLWQRERKRRYALWDLEKLQPGSDHAIQYLAILDEIERQDRDDPIGDAVAMSVEELRECVPETEIVEVSGSHFVVVLDEHIPEPWRTRSKKRASDLLDYGKAVMRVIGAAFYDCGQPRCSTSRRIGRCVRTRWGYS